MFRGIDRPLIERTSCIDSSSIARSLLTSSQCKYDQFQGKCFAANSVYRVTG